ncbi:unnamed protein product [Brugia timori]|uniref:ZP domain-containing protein n=1 Tax=Brugia timori TaxID=42155 RepID=A0A0R3Q4W3_9BILA|nr:unnamed protein product [Brugia timori]
MQILIAIILAANVICTENGITANIKFNRFFDGTIYSAEYSTNLDCIYHNRSDMPILAIEFTIPLNKCGTRIARNTRNVIISIIVDLIENLVCIQMEAKQSQASINHHFLLTCQLVPQVGIPLIQTQDGKTSLLVTNQTNLWKKIPEYGFSEQKMKSEFDLENNWGNWPIDSNLTPNEPLSDIMFANSEENFQNGSLELLSTTEETLLINTSSITASTSTNINIASSKNPNILMKVLEVIRLWPKFSNKTTPKIDANISTTIAMDTKFRTNSTSKWKRRLESVRIYATQLPNQKPITANTPVYMEIRHTNEIPFGSKINGPVQIGENISLVIRSRSHNSESDTYNFFVHSCYASDKQGLEKLLLIDQFGCTVQPKLTGQMIRMKSAEQTYYYFWVSAFKFPGPDDVYFTCAIDISQNKSFPEGCGKEENESRRRSLLTLLVCFTINAIQICYHVCIT